MSVQQRQRRFSPAFLGAVTGEMLWGVVVLLAAAALGVESYATHDHERLAHGRQLKIYLSRNAEVLEFIPAFDPNRIFVYWEKGKGGARKGRISGSGNDRRWYIDQVTYEDQGTYIERDFWKKEISEFKVAVTPRHNYLKCIAGETLYISLEGIDRADAALTFAGPTSNITLVQDGSRVSQDHPEYFDRVYVMSKIEIRNVNTSDEGYYYLRDRKDRLVSVTKMDLTDKHDTVEGNPLMALLLLLGIPAGICCCCRKKIFKKQKASTTATLQTSPGEVVHTPPGGPVGPCPPYNSPGQPGAVYIHSPDPSMGPSVHPPPPATGPAPWNGPPPSPGFNPAYPPQNPAYPPAGPAMVPPAGPQWNGPPPGQYPPGPGAPMGYAPVMYSSPPPAAGEPVKEEIKMENMAPSSADPLLNATPEAAAPSASGPPTSTSYQYNVDGASAPNFL